MLRLKPSWYHWTESKVICNRKTTCSNLRRVRKSWGSANSKLNSGVCNHYAVISSRDSASLHQRTRLLRSTLSLALRGIRCAESVWQVWAGLWAAQHEQNTSTAIRYTTWTKVCRHLTIIWASWTTHCKTFALLWHTLHFKCKCNILLSLQSSVVTSD